MRRIWKFTGLSFFLLLMILLACYFCVQWDYKSGDPEDFFYQRLMNPGFSGGSPRNGDILLWSNTSLESLGIQQMTEGCYSHCGLLFRKSDGQIFVLDVYPDAGLRYMPLRDYLKPKKHELVQVGLVRYKGEIDEKLMQDHLNRILAIRDDIVFDKQFLYEESDDDIFNASDQTGAHALYCGELIYLIYKDCARHLKLFENGYDQVMRKWSELNVKNQSAGLYYLKIFFVKKNLSALQAASRKIFFSPNLFLTDGQFEIIQEIKGKAEPLRLKKTLTDLPKKDKDSISLKQGTVR